MESSTSWTLLHFPAAGAWPIQDDLARQLESTFPSAFVELREGTGLIHGGVRFHRALQYRDPGPVKGSFSVALRVLECPVCLWRVEIPAAFGGVYAEHVTPEVGSEFHLIQVPATWGKAQLDALRAWLPEPAVSSIALPEERGTYGR